MKTKFAMLLALAALVVGENARAGVVDATASGTLSSTFNGTIRFTVSASSNARLDNIRLKADTSNQTFNLTVTLKNNSEGQIGQVSGLYTAKTDGTQNFALTGLTELTAGTTYLLQIQGNGGTTNSLVGSSLYGTQTGSVFQNIYNSNASPFEYIGGTDQPFFSMDVTAVPEPGTMILTGTALAAGAVGAYFKRRRKAKAEVAA